MSADLHIHVFDEPGLELTEDDLRVLFSHSFGSKWFDEEDMLCHFTDEARDASRTVDKKAFRTPDVWVGSMSFLKAMCFDDDDSFIPDTVGLISDIIGEDLPVCDDALIAKVADAFDAENITPYGIAEKGDVVDFLKAHKGRKLFTIAW